MKKFIEYIKSPKSDFLLFVIILILANLICAKAFFRIDLTKPKSYSLSESSIEVVKTLEEPLSVQVFFSRNLPAPYSTVDQYVRDILAEYKGKANSNFTCEFFDMEKPDNERLARSLGINQVQIQELKNNEIGFKQAWMGIAISYADRTEIINALNSTDGIEYKLTSTITKLISTTSALAGLDGSVELTLYATEKLSEFGISGFDSLERYVREAFNIVNEENMGRIEFKRVDPPESEIPQIAQKYGIQTMRWNSPEPGTGILGLVLEYGENFRTIPLEMRSIFGQYLIAGLDSLHTELAENLKSLVSKSEKIAYITGHDELSLEDSNYGAGLFNTLVSDTYEFEPVNLSEEDIPSSIRTAVINGPRTKFSDSELYKLDQFLMKGGNLMILADQFDEKYPEGQAAYYQMPTYTPVETGLEKILSNYGVEIGKNYVMDKNCYVNQDRIYGSTPFYFAPLLQKTNFSRNNVITDNLGYVILLQSSSINIEKALEKAEENKNFRATVLARSSDDSWLMEENVSAVPQQIFVPSDESVFKSENLAVLLEGEFTSAFDSAPRESSGDETETAETGAEENADSSLQTDTHYIKSVKPGKLFVLGSSKITTPQVIDESGKQPAAMFIRNAVDYMNGQTDLCLMRTKGLSLNTLKENSGAAVNFATYFNEFGLVVLIAICGLAVLLKIRAKKNRIRMKYNPNDERQIQQK